MELSKKNSKLVCFFFSQARPNHAKQNIFLSPSRARCLQLHKFWCQQSSDLWKISSRAAPALGTGKCFCIFHPSLSERQTEQSQSGGKGISSSVFLLEHPRQSVQPLLCFGDHQCPKPCQPFLLCNSFSSFPSLCPSLLNLQKQMRIRCCPGIFVPKIQAGAAELPQTGPGM